MRTPASGGAWASWRPSARSAISSPGSASAPATCRPRYERSTQHRFQLARGDLLAFILHAKDGLDAAKVMRDHDFQTLGRRVGQRQAPGRVALQLGKIRYPVDVQRQLRW